MSFRFSDLPIGAKVASTIPLFVLALLLLLGVALSSFRAELMAGRELKTRHVVETASGVVERFAARVAAGELTAENGRKEALATLAAMRYGAGEYLFVTDQQGVILMHPVSAELVGRDMRGTKDANGVAFIDALLAEVRAKGDGVVHYQWAKPGAATKDPVAKITYGKAVPPWGWMLASGIYVDDIDAAFRAHALELAGIAAGIVVAVVVLLLLVARAIARPLTRMTVTMRALAGGHLEAVVEDGDRRDEIGHMAEAVQVFRAGLVQARDLAETQRREQAIKEEQQAHLQAAIREFELTIVGVVDGLSGADHAMRTSAKRMSSSSAETKDQVATVAGASQEASSNVQAVAAASEELTSSIQEIARQSSHASAVAARAVREASATTDAMRALEQTVSGIGDVASLINDIASQTNLLALNATIEAARAGEAGKGFAVVANEVKALANQTARATDEITRQIGAVQERTRTSADAISGIASVVTEVSGVATAISAAVEEQHAATQEIARNAEQAAAGTASVSGAIQRVEAAAEEAGVATDELEATAALLGRQAESLKARVHEFLREVRFEGVDNSTLVTWGKDLEFGVPHIDNEHRKLMDLVNHVYASVKAGAGPDVLAAAFAELRRYASKHFAEEEAFMTRLRYPQADEHRRQHQTFLGRLDALAEDFQRGSTSTSIDVVSLLGSWWQNHIVGADAAVARHAASAARADRAA